MWAYWLTHMKIKLASYKTLYGAFCELKKSNSLISLTYNCKDKVLPLGMTSSTTIELGVRSETSHDLIVKTRAGTTVVFGLIDGAEIECISVRNELVNILSQQDDTIKQTAQSLETHLRNCECVPDYDPAIEQTALMTYPALNAMVNTLQNYGAGTQAIVEVQTPMRRYLHTFELFPDAFDCRKLILVSSSDELTFHINAHDVVTAVSYKTPSMTLFTHTVEDTAAKMQNIEGVLLFSPLIEYKER